MRHVDRIIGRLLRDEAHRVTLFGAGRVTRATRKLFRRRIDRREKLTEVVVTFGPPNYRERKLLRTGKAKRGTVWVDRLPAA